VGFKRGCAPGPGRPKGSLGGRQRALQVLDDLLAREGNLKALGKALQTEFDRDPADFWQRFAVPLIPRSHQVGFEGSVPRAHFYDPADPGRELPELWLPRKLPVPGSLPADVADGRIQK
jgi:hypothetical protein